MRRTRIGAVLAAVCVTGAVCGAAGAAVPLRLREGVQDFVDQARTLEQSQIIPTAQAVDREAQAGVAPCEQDLLARSSLAQAVRLQGHWLRGDVRAAQTGASGVLALAPALGSRRSPARGALVAAVGRVGSELALQLADARDVAGGADAIASGDCAAGAGTVSAAAEQLAVVRGAVDAALSRLLSRF